MAWKKTPAYLIDLFGEVLPEDDRIERRSMFGCPCIFINGNLCAGLHEETMMLRLNPQDQSRFFEEGATEFAPMKGRVMREYAVVPEEFYDDPEQIRQWLMKSIEFVGSLPPKEKKAPKDKKKKNKDL